MPVQVFVASHLNTAVIGSDWEDEVISWLCAMRVRWGEGGGGKTFG